MMNFEANLILSISRLMSLTPKWIARQLCERGFACSAAVDATLASMLLTPQPRWARFVESVR